MYKCFSILQVMVMNHKHVVRTKQLQRTISKTGPVKDAATITIRLKGPIMYGSFLDEPQTCGTNKTTSMNDFPRLDQ